MKYDSAFIEKVKAFGILGYPAHKIIHLVKPEDPEQFLLDFDEPTTVIYQAYHEGQTTGQYTLDKSLFDQAKGNSIEANDKLIQRQQNERIDTAIYERFKL